MRFEVGDSVVAYNRFAGWISYINYEEKLADIEFDDDNYWDGTVVPFEHLKKVEN